MVRSTYDLDPIYYSLDEDNQTVGHGSVHTWAAEMEKARSSDRWRVAETETAGHNISTVFLGLNHGWGGVIQLFETMCFVHERHPGKQVDFGPRYDIHTFNRYATWEEAIEGHCLAVVAVQSYEHGVIEEHKRRLAREEELRPRMGPLKVKRKTRL